MNLHKGNIYGFSSKMREQCNGSKDIIRFFDSRTNGKKSDRTDSGFEFVCLGGQNKVDSRHDRSGLLAKRPALESKLKSSDQTSDRLKNKLVIKDSFHVTLQVSGKKDFIGCVKK